MIGRIQDRATFERLRREGTRLRIDPLWCSFVPDPEVTPTRVAFSIGRATGNAVVRNRLRRRLRAILAVSEPPPGVALVGAAPAAAELTFDELSLVMSSLVAAMHERAQA